MVLFYQGLSKQIQVANYRDLLLIIYYRQQRNVEEHEVLDDYVRHCIKTSRKPDFMMLLKELDLTALTEYKREELITLEKVFLFYYEQKKYR